MTKIAFIGLGNMGGPMALNLAKAGYDLTVSDLDPARTDVITQAGASYAETARDAVTDADIVMTSLPGPKQIAAMASGEAGMLGNMKKGAIWIELSTNNLEVERDVREKASHHGIHMLDAPVSGGTEGAAKGTLTIMVGGDLAIFKQVETILKVIGGDVMHLGDHGAGYVAKIAQVVLCYLNSVALSEALMLGVKGGVDAATMLSIIQNSTGKSYVADRYGPPLLEGSYDPGFALGLAHKDMRLTLELAASTNTSLPMCEQVEALYASAVEKYGPHQNHLMALKLLEEANGLELRNSKQKQSA